MLKRKIIKIGNSYGITIPPAIIENMGIDVGDTVAISIKKVS
jgi:antitoxin component of MazEF toxin-antitoxin module